MTIAFDYRQRQSAPQRREAAPPYARPVAANTSVPWPVVFSILLHALVLFWVARDASVLQTPSMDVAPAIHVSMVTEQSAEIVDAAPPPAPPKPLEHKAEPVTRAASPDAVQNTAAPSESQSSSLSSPAGPVVAPQAPPGPVVTEPSFNAAYLKNPSPVYPNMSRRLRETGTVRVRVVVGIDGAPISVTLAESAGFQRLDEAALATIRRWRFQPAMRGDTPVEAPVIVPLEFSLKGLE